MSSKARSPTAHILRSSRFFSLPRPLPMPHNGLAGEPNSYRMSDTATLPYPVQQAIATPASSLKRGDWGLKRSLPLHSTTSTSTPVLRINAVDTSEHITDFESSSDLTLSLRKIQELGLSATVSSQRYGAGFKDRQISAFEPRFDNTDPRAVHRDPRDVESEAAGKRRWKYRGPWVAGMSPADFDEYVAKELKRRKPEFTSFLRERSRQQILLDRKSQARSEGVEVDDVVTETDIDAHIRTLRNEYDLNSSLARLITEFLDLPETHRSGSDFVDRYRSKSADEGPPVTHPSAGLSYLRSDAVLDNHPLFGPQSDHAPTEGRILGGKGRTEASGNGASGFIGVAGVVSPPPQGQGGRMRSIPPLPDRSDPAELRDRNANSLGLGTPGGNRIWVSPTTLEIDSRGRTRLSLVNPNPVAVGIHTGELYTPGLPAPPPRNRSRSGTGGRDVPKQRVKPKLPRKDDRYGIGPGGISFDGTGDIVRMLNRQYSAEALGDEKR